MKWNSTPGSTGTSEKRTPLNRAPMYSLKRLELEAAEGGSKMRAWRRKKREKTAKEAIRFLAATM